MNHKVLLADDSLTIQKVIKITLANQPFQIVDCSSEDELFKQLEIEAPDIVLLDFNLSEKYTGYELTSKIKDMAPKAEVLLLLGTFDSVDDAMMERCGAADKIVKPFDSNKFISICKRLADKDLKTEKIDFPEIGEKTEEFVVPSINDEQWTMSHSVERKELPVQPMELSEAETSSFNQLDQEISDWGMSIPGVISESSDSSEERMDLPPVIEDENVIAFRSESVKNENSEVNFPNDEDLDYPTIEQLSSTPAQSMSQETTSKFISLESLNDSDFEIEHKINSVEETDISSIEAQIRDEVEENLWSADEFENLKNEVSSKIDEVKSQYQPSADTFDNSLFKGLDDDELQWTTGADVTSTHQTQSNPIDTDAIVNQLRSEVQTMIKAEVKAYMDQMFAQNVEKVSWEVIPDLAENLIRTELQKISNKVISDS